MQIDGDYPSEGKVLKKQLKIYQDILSGGWFLVKCDKTHTLVEGDDVFFGVYGYTIESFAKKFNCDSCGPIHMKDLDKVINCIKIGLENGDDSVAWSMRIITEDGKTKTVNVHAYFEADGEDMYLRGIIFECSKYDRVVEKLKTNEELYAVVLKETQISLWRYNIQDKILTMIQCDPDNAYFADVMENVPESIIETGVVHEDSKKEFRKLYGRIAAGESRAEAELQLVSKEKQGRIWVKLTITNLFNEFGAPTNAVVLLQDITRQKEAEIAYQQELQLRDMDSDNFIAGSNANLNKNKVEYTRSKQGNNHKLVSGISYDDMTEMGAEGMVNSDDKERYYKSLSKEALLAAFEQGRTVVSMDYRRKDENGKIYWVKATARLIRDAISGDVYSYSSIRNINKQKVIEHALHHRVECDSLTGAYTKETAMGMIRDAMEQEDKDQKSYALLLFGVDKFSDIISNSGYKIADNSMCKLYELLQEQLHYVKIIGRMFKNEMVVWIGDSPDRAALCEEIEKIREDFSILSAIVSGEIFTLSVGITFSLYGQCTSSDMFSRSTEALSQCQQTGGNRCIVSEDYSDVHDLPYQFSRIGVNAGDVGEVIMQCACSLSSVSDFAKAVLEVLEVLAKYYGTKQACLVELEHNGKEIERVHYLGGNLKEATKQNKVVSSLVGLLAGKKRITISDVNKYKDYDDAICEKIREASLEGVYGLRLENNGETEGYIFVCNPTANLDRIILLELIGCICANDMDKRRMKEKVQYRDNNDELTGLLNRNRYLNYVECLMPDTIISLGVVSADINGLKQINSQYGYAYGDRMLLFTAKVMREEFSEAMIFRIESDEFVVICENITAEAFRKKVERMKRSLNETYPMGVAVGDVWTDTDVDTDKLVYQADEKMMLAKHRYYADTNLFNKRYDPYAEKKLIEDVAGLRYEVFLQPKAIIESSVISGAEALVRYRGTDGNIVFPDKFIPQLEQNGSICYLDLFVFEEVCRMLKRWGNEGNVQMPISLNFSRSTLLTENLIQRMEDIYSKYLVPKELIEIEVTESIGSLERETLIQISAEIVNNNYRLALDDFGAKYSNLSILSTLELHVLKLDKSLVSDLFSNLKTQIVVRNFLVACCELDIRSVAEGVETREQLETLKTLGCDYAQGYYFNKPIPCDEFERLYLHS